MSVAELIELYSKQHAAQCQARDAEVALYRGMVKLGAEIAAQKGVRVGEFAQVLIDGAHEYRVKVERCEAFTADWTAEPPAIAVRVFGHRVLPTGQLAKRGGEWWLSGRHEGVFAL